MDQTLQGTMTGINTKDKTKLRQSIVDMMQRRKDPGFVKYAHYAMGYDPSDIEKELGYYTQYTTGQPATQPQMVSGASTITSSVAQELGQGEASISLLNELEKTVQDNTHSDVFAPVRGRLKSMNPYDTEAQSVQAQINSTKQLIGKYMEGGVLRKEDEIKYEKILPKIGDTAKTAQAKIDMVRQMIENKSKSEVKTLGQTGYDISGMVQGQQEQQTQQHQRTAPWKPEDDAQALEWAKNNPNDPRTKQIYDFLGQSAETPQTTAVTTPLNTPLSPSEEAGRGGESNYDEVLKDAGPLTKLADKVGGFLGVKKFAQGIGATMFLLSKEGKELQKKAESGDKIAIEAMQDILGEAPTGKEVVGSAALTALNIGSVGMGKALSGARAGAKIATGATTGGIFGVAGGLEQNKDAAGVAKSGLLGAAVGGAISSAGVGYDKLKKAKTAVSNDKVKKAVGQIIQGKRKDIPKALKALKRIDTKGVKTYEDLISRFDDNMSALGELMDTVLSKDTTSYPLRSLTKATQVGNKTIKTNYVKKAMEGLKELYHKSSDDPNAERINQLLKKARSQGLTLQEVNAIAKEYGRSGNAFTRAGELKKTTSSVSFENIRKGIKDTLRNSLPDDKSKMIDKAFYENMRTTDLLSTMAENVNKLMQRVQKRGLTEKGGRLIGKAVEKVPVLGGGAKGFLQAFVPSNAGNKTMNALALQDALKSNLKVIEKNGDKISQKIAEKISTGGPVSQAFIQNLLREFRDND